MCERNFTFTPIARCCCELWTTKVITYTRAVLMKSSWKCFSVQLTFWQGNDLEINGFEFVRRLSGSFEANLKCQIRKWLMFCWLFQRKWQSGRHLRGVSFHEQIIELANYSAMRISAAEQQSLKQHQLRLDWGSCVVSAAQFLNSNGSDEHGSVGFWSINCRQWSRAWWRRISFPGDLITPFRISLSHIKQKPRKSSVVWFIRLRESQLDRKFREQLLRNQRK